MDDAFSLSDVTDECTVEYDNNASMQLKNVIHNCAVLKEMKSMYDEGLLTDVVLHVQGRTFPCHRNVLAATSPYFKAMFTIDLTEKNQKHIDLLEVDFQSVSQLIDYAYTGRVKISRQNVQSLLATASLFQIMPVHRACAKFLATQLDNQNCIGIHCFAQLHNCEDLKFIAKEHIEKNFVEVCKGEEFLNLSSEQIAELVASDELNVDREETVFESIMAWVIADEDSRLQYLHKLLPHVRMGLLASRYIREHIEQNKFVLDCDKCMHFLNSLKHFENNPQNYSGDFVFGLTLRSGMIKPEHCLLMVGGSDQLAPSINCYNPLTREAYLMGEFPETRKSFCYDVDDIACIVTPVSTLYAGGGNYIYRDNFNDHDSDEDSLEEYEERVLKKDFYRYDNDHNQWVSLAPMLFPKSNFTLAYLGGKIYSFGGLTENQHLTEIIEVYDIEKNKWNYQGMLPTTLVDLNSVVYGNNIYLLGGRTGVGSHNLVLKYGPHQGQWTSMALMPTPRFNFGACTVDGEIFVAGGQIYSHTTNTITREALRSVEIYNIAQNQWRQGPELPEGMYNLGLALISGAVYACGTAEYHKSQIRVYRYNVVYRLDLGRNQWEQVESELSETQNFHCVATKLHTRKLSQVFRPDVDT